MPSHEVTAAFFGVSLLLAFSPGPDNLFVLAQSVMRGRRAGMLVVLGLCTGLVAHTALVASGLAVVFAASASAFVVLKLIGSAYLLFLAWQAFHVTDARNDEKAASAGHRADTFASDVAATGVPTPMPLQMYIRGIIMNLTNPKVILFFLAFLPQFVQIGKGPVALQLCWFGFIFILATLLAFGTIACLAGTIGQRFLHSGRAQRMLNRLAGRNCICRTGSASRIVCRLATLRNRRISERRKTAWFELH